MQNLRTFWILAAAVGLSFVGCRRGEPAGPAERRIAPVPAAPLAEVVAEKRVALVVGNGNYGKGPLKNPVSDAEAVARKLEGLSFQVLFRKNVGLDDFKAAIREFARIMENAGGAALFYYSGHGYETRGKNYLIPVDAVIRQESATEAEAVDVNRILEILEGARNRVNIVILDSCRDDPFTQSFRSATRGLTSMDAPKGTLIAYSTAPQHVAADGDGPHSPFTKYLLQCMDEPGLKIEDVFKRVRAEVLKETDGIQMPWESSSLVGDFFLHPSSSPRPPAAETVVPAADNLLPPRPPVSPAMEKALHGLAVNPQRMWETEAAAGLKLVYLPPGEFLMGSPEGELFRNSDESPVHTVQLTRGLWMGKQEVTVGQFSRFIEETGYRTAAERGGGAFSWNGTEWEKRTDANWTRPSFVQAPESPVTCIAWNDAAAFCRWLTEKTGLEFRLPTEAEWEYASRAGTRTPFFSGAQLDDRAANFDADFPYGRTNRGLSPGRTTAAGRYPANPWGLLDMPGNVWEWCSDWYDPVYYRVAPPTDPQGPSGGTKRVVRGGCWMSGGSALRSGGRAGSDPNERANVFGFRVCLSGQSSF